MKRIATPQLAALVASLGTLTLLAGCGGGDNNDSDLNGFVPSPINSPAVSRYVGTYNAVVALSEGRTGRIALTVGADNRANGTLTVSDTARSRQATAFSFASGVYAISGTVDPTTGAFNMSGSIGGQPFSYVGTLPAPGNGNVGGSYTLTYGGQTITGTFGGLPTPVVSPTPTPSPTVSPTPAPPSTAVNTLTVTPEGSDAHNNSHTGAYSVKVTASGYRLPTVIGATPVGANINVKCEEASDKVTFSLNLDLTMPATNPLATGTFPVKYGSPTETPANTLFTYQEYGYVENNTTTRSWQSYHYPDAGEGQVVIEQVDASKVRMRFENVLVHPTAFQNGKGKLRINGVVETSNIFFAN